MTWISSKEKLPGKEERVLIYTPFDFFGSDHACIGDKQSLMTCKTRCGREMVPIFTHWMPLPELPEQPRP